MSSDNCCICDEKINKSNHSLIICPFCSFNACRSCCEIFVLDKTTAMCMNINCGKEWSRKQIVNAFTKTFVNDKWKKNREKVLLDKEIALLPATQIIVEQQIQKEKYISQIKELDIIIAELNQRRKIILYKMNNQLNTESSRKVFVRACRNDNCRGFLSSQWKCGLCENFTCSDCHVVKGLTRDCIHTCNPDEVATAKLLDKDTKCCPKCSTGIFKIDGCDQMWCTQCHTAFSWRTGIIETKIHNPHFYEWQRLTLGSVPRNPEDNLCGNIELTHRTIQDISKLIYKKVGITNTPLKNDAELLYIKISKIIRKTLHLSQIQMPTYQVNNVENNLKLRVRYLRNQITKDEFKIQLQRDNKKHEKKREMYEILQLFVNTVIEIINRVKFYIEEYKDNCFKKALITINEIDSIQEYVNDCFLEISKTYNSKPKKIILCQNSLNPDIEDVLINS
jgi:hypothetical protein